MAITTKSFADLVRGQAAAIQGAAAGLVDFTVGSILRALSEAVASVALWLQGQVLALLLVTRAATSTGADLDSFVADFGLTREPAQAAAGNVTFSRFSTTLQAIVPILTGGQPTTVRSSDGSQAYSVSVDATNPAYNAALGGYVMGPGVGSVTVPVVALVAGAAGNAQVGAVTVISSSIPGVDTVTNPSNFSQGADGETDVALRTRFQGYIASLSKATRLAVLNAIASVSASAVSTISENVTYAGLTKAGNFSVVVDDGSGSPPTSFLNAVAAAVDLVRPLSSTFEVHAPTVVNATVAMTLGVAAGYSKSAVAAAVQTAVLAYINTLPLGQTLAYTRLAQVAYDASAGVTNVSGLSLNGGTSDLFALATQVIKTTVGAVTVSAP